MIIPKYRIVKENPSIRFYRDVYCIAVMNQKLAYKIYALCDHFFIEVSEPTGKSELYKSILSIPEMDSVVAEHISADKSTNYHIEFDTVLISQSAFENQTELKA